MYILKHTKELNMNPLTFNLPKDLWFEFEALCKANKSKPLQSLRSRVLDAKDDPKKVLMGVWNALNTPRTDETILKGVRWDEATWDIIRGFAKATGSTNVAILRAILENAVRDQDVHIAFYREKESTFS